MVVIRFLNIEWSADFLSTKHCFWAYLTISTNTNVTCSNKISINLLTQVTHKNRQRRMARIIADMRQEPEPYLIPKLQTQQQQQYKFTTSCNESAASAVACTPGFGKDIMGDQVVPKPGSRYADLGGVEPISLISFAYQIATGMVSQS